MTVCTLPGTTTGPFCRDYLSRLGRKEEAFTPRTQTRGPAAEVEAVEAVRGATEAPSHTESIDEAMEPVGTQCINEFNLRLGERLRSACIGPCV